MMKTVLFVLSFAFAMTTFAKSETNSATDKKRTPASPLKGTSQISIEKSSGWIRVEGEVAKAMYEALSVPATNDNEGAGPSTYFKYGKSYTCVYESSANAYHCNFMVSDFSKGSLKN